MARRWKVAGIALLVLLVGGPLSAWLFGRWHRAQVLADFTRQGGQFFASGDGSTYFVDARKVSRFDDDALKLVASVVHIRSADLSQTEVTDHGVRSLVEQAKSSLNLRLSGTSISDAACDSLSTIDPWYLDLSATPVTLNGIRQLWRFDLSYLSLDKTSVDDQIFSISRPGTSNHPPILRLAETRITDAGLANIKDDFHGLCLANTKVSDTGLIPISKGSLVWLDLAGTRVSDEGLESLSRLPFLRVLRLANTRVTADGLSRLHATLPKVCVIDLEPESASPRQRLMDAMCRGELFGKLSDSLWAVLNSAANGILPMVIGLKWELRTMLRKVTS